MTIKNNEEAFANGIKLIEQQKVIEKQEESLK